MPNETHDELKVREEIVRNEIAWASTNPDRTRATSEDAIRRVWRTAREFFGSRLTTEREARERAEDGLRKAIGLIDADAFDRVEIEPLRGLVAGRGQSARDRWTGGDPDEVHEILETIDRALNPDGEVS